jgi:5-methylcytosine-specific restriction endonuclease McrA
MNQYKSCRVCKVNKPLGDFSRYYKSSDGLNGRCRACAKDYYDRNRATILAQKVIYNQIHRETKSKLRKIYYKKHADRLRLEKRAYYLVNGEVIRAKNREWARNNREKMNCYYRQYAVDRPDVIRKKRIKRRIRMMTNGIFEVTKKDLRKLLSSSCVYCEANENITLDHVIPIARGGRHSVGNLMPLCLSCNTSKQDKTFMEFRMAKMMQAEVKL